MKNKMRICSNKRKAKRIFKLVIIISIVVMVIGKFIVIGNINKEG